jgi:Fe-S oxidoreductase
VRTIVADPERPFPETTNAAGALSPEALETVRRTLDEVLDHRLAAYLSGCVRCGLCAETCHYYLADPDPRNIPAYKLQLVNAVFNRRFRRLGRIAPAWIGARELDNALAAEWFDALFGRCSLCGRCGMHCSVGLDISRAIRAGRTALAAAGAVPAGLASTVRTAVESGNNMGITLQDWVETVAWLEEELQMETGDPSARLPMDQPGARLLYTVNPREPKFFPLTIVAMGKFFYAAGESWTLASDSFDLTNYGLFSGENEKAGLMSSRLDAAMARLGAGMLVMGECGHGFNANRWEAPEWFGRRPAYPVRSVLEVVADYIRDGRIRFDPARVPKRVTLHDPCNLVRLGGVYEPQRIILRQAVADFVEMTPHGADNYCCGGGGGQLSMTEFTDRRLQAGRLKADQIRATGAQIVAAPCHNCLDQLMELNKHYKLGVEIKSVCEVAADALVL